jgi:hypothetical protein
MTGSQPHPQTGQPIGLPVDTTPAKLPGPVTLQGRYGRLEKLDAGHAAARWPRVKDHDDIWTYMSRYGGPFSGLAEFSELMAGFTSGNDPYPYAIVDGDARDRSRSCGLFVRSPANAARYRSAVFAGALCVETLGYRRYEWKCNALHDGSRRAARRLGLTFEGVHRQLVIAKGRNRDTTWFSMLDGEWPARKANFERWLAPENFTADGKQKVSLSALNSATE